MSYGLYIHLPFCSRRCPYCAFTSSTGMLHTIPDYLDALERELSMFLGRHPFINSPETIYIGGGTPSLVPEEGIAALIDAAAGKGAREVTIEGNPESIKRDWLESLRKAGVNRLSIGMQSFDDEILSRLGRAHDSKTALRTFRLARETGYENISIDLMYGIPGQSENAWRETVSRAIELAPDHLSCYALSVEEDTEYFNHFSDHPEMLPCGDMTADMYLMMREMLDDAGYEWYEISNFALPGRECLHNLHYWDFTPYLGVGASAHSFDGVRRFWNTVSPMEYIRLAQQGEMPHAGSEYMDDRMRLQEHIMLAVRTRRGLPLTIRENVQKPDAFDVYIAKLVRLGYGNIVKGRLVLTQRGAMLSDEISGDVISMTGET